MSIVFITIPGATKREFANRLYQKTNGGLELVIIQKLQRKKLKQRLIHLYKHVGWNIFTEIWYAVLLRLNRRSRTALEYFRENTLPNSSDSYSSKTLEVDSVNSDEIHETLKKISPKLIVAWGCKILEPRILSTAEKAINLHLGYCPYYRGTLANQYAVLSDDFSKIGATIHYMDSKADTGDIITVIPANTKKLPKELFCDLNDRAIAEYLKIAVELHAGKNLPAKTQDTSKSKNFLLKSWTPKIRYKLGKKIIAWEQQKKDQLVSEKHKRNIKQVKRRASYPAPS